MTMAATPPSSPKPSGSTDENSAPIMLEDRLNAFWQKNRVIVLGLCVAVLLAIIGKGLWEHYERAQERDIQAAFDAAATPDQLHAFTVAHPEHPLAAVAEIRLADEAYAAGKPSDAIGEYEKAIAILKNGPLATRAQLGRALAEVQAGKTSDGTAALKQLFDDPTQFKAARAEAGYQLASLAADGGNTAEVQKDLDQLMQIDPTSPWTQRAMMLRATFPAPAASTTATPGSATSAGTTKAGDASPSVQVKIPGK